MSQTARRVAPLRVPLALACMESRARKTIGFNLIMSWTSLSVALAEVPTSAPSPVCELVDLVDVAGSVGVGDQVGPPRAVSEGDPGAVGRPDRAANRVWGVRRRAEDEDWGRAVR